MTATAANEAIVSDEEFEERVRVLRKLRYMLLRQRDRLRNYLAELENEGDAIRDGDVDRFERHVELEKNIVREIFTFRQAIEPLEAVYRAAYPETAVEYADLDSAAAAAPDPEIPLLSAHLEKLQDQVLRRNEENRELLHLRVEDLRHQVDALKLTERGAPLYRAQAYGTAVSKRGAHAGSPGNVVDIST